MDTSIITPPVESLHSPELNNIISNAEPPRPRDEPPESEASEMETQMSTSRITHPVDLGGGDFILRVNGVEFKTHKYQLDKFSVLQGLMRAVDYSDDPLCIPTISVQRDERGVEDFSNTFTILYASIIKGPFAFDPPVLISALRISSAYDYPDLRTFCIRHLEGIPLTAVQRIELACECRITSWEATAYEELCKREDAITQEEARVLGIDALSVVARRREEEKVKKGEAALEAEKSKQEESLKKVRKEVEQQIKRMASELEGAKIRAGQLASEQSRREAAEIRVGQFASELARVKREAREAQKEWWLWKALLAALVPLPEIEVVQEQRRPADPPPEAGNMARAGFYLLLLDGWILVAILLSLWLLEAPRVRDTDLASA